MPSSEELEKERKKCDCCQSARGEEEESFDPIHSTSDLFDYNNSVENGKNLGFSHIVRENDGRYTASYQYLNRKNRAIRADKQGKIHKFDIEFDNCQLKYNCCRYRNKKEIIDSIDCFKTNIVDWLFSFLVDDLRICRWQRDSIYQNNKYNICSIYSPNFELWHLKYFEKYESFKYYNGRYNYIGSCDTLKPPFVDIVITINDSNIDREIEQFFMNKGKIKKELLINKIHISISFTNMKVKSIVYKNTNYTSYQKIIEDFIRENFYSKAFNYFSSFNKYISTNFSDGKLLFKNHSLNDKKVICFRISKILSNKYFNLILEPYPENNKIYLEFIRPGSLIPDKFYLDERSIEQEINYLFKTLMTSQIYNHLPSNRKIYNWFQCSELNWTMFSNKFHNLLDIYMKNKFETDKFLCKYIHEKKKEGIDIDYEVSNTFFSDFININYDYENGYICIEYWLESQLDFIKSLGEITSIPFKVDGEPFLFKKIDKSLIKKINLYKLNKHKDKNLFSNIVELAHIYNKIYSYLENNNDELNIKAIFPNLKFISDDDIALEFYSLKKKESILEAILDDIELNKCYNCRERISSVDICDNCSLCYECFDEYISSPIDFTCYCGCGKKVKSFSDNIFDFDFIPRTKNGFSIRNYLHNGTIRTINTQYCEFKKSITPLISAEQSIKVERKVLDLRCNKGSISSSEFNIMEGHIVTGCLNCGHILVKDEGCNAINCPKCPSEFCAECMVQRKDFPCKCSKNQIDHFSHNESATATYFEDVFPINKSRINILGTSPYQILFEEIFTNYLHSLENDYEQNIVLTEQLLDI